MPDVEKQPEKKTREVSLGRQNLGQRGFARLEDTGAGAGLVAGCSQAQWTPDGTAWQGPGLRLTVPKGLKASPGQGTGLKITEGPGSVFSFYASHSSSQQAADAELATYQSIDADWGTVDQTAPRDFSKAKPVTVPLGDKTHYSLTGLGAWMGRPVLLRMGYLTDQRHWLLYHVIIQDGSLENEKRERQQHEAWTQEILAGVRFDP